MTTKTFFTKHVFIAFNLVLLAFLYNACDKENLPTTNNKNKSDTLINEDFLITANISDVLCNGLAQGAIDLTIEGGEKPFIFSWSNGETTEDLDSLSAGIYKVSVIDSENKKVEKSFEVNEPDLILITHKTIDNDTSTLFDLTVTGGIKPYTYNWSTGATSEDIEISNYNYSNINVSVYDSAKCFHKRLVRNNDIALLIYYKDSLHHSITHLKNLIGRSGFVVKLMAIEEITSNTNFSDYDICVLPELIPSSLFQEEKRYRVSEELPVLTFEAYAFMNYKNAWGWFEGDESDFWAEKSEIDNTDEKAIRETTEIEIAEDHEIYKGVGERGDVFSLAKSVVEGEEEGAFFQCMDFSKGIMKDYAQMIGESTLADNINANATGVIWIIEESSISKPMVIFGLQQSYMGNNLTPECEKVIVNSLYWLSEPCCYNLEP